MEKLKVGDYFAVTRGTKLSSGEYDQSDEGKIFQVLEICGIMVSVKIIVGLHGLKPQGHQAISLNPLDYVITPVTQKYVDSVLGPPLE